MIQTPNALPGLETVGSGTTGLELRALRNAMPLPTVSGAMQNAIGMGVTGLAILAPMALMYTGIMTTLGMPPKFLKTALGQG